MTFPPSAFTAEENSTPVAAPQADLKFEQIRKSQFRVIGGIGTISGNAAGAAAYR